MHTFVRGVHHLIVFAHVPQVAGDESLELCAYQGKCTFVLCFVKLYFLFVCRRTYVCHEGIVYLELVVEGLEVFVVFLQFGTVLLDVACRRLDDDAFGHQLAVPVGVERRVDGTKKSGMMLPPP